MLFSRLALILGVAGFSCAAWGDEALDWQKPIEAGQLQRVKFGSYSHWLQPWRGYFETVPATRFLDGLGVVLNTHRGEDVEQILRMCAANGLRQVRLEIGWGSLDFETESKLRNGDEMAKRLRACRAVGMRPMILLNGHHGAPCPLRNFERTVMADAAVGAREVVLDVTEGLVPGHSGLSNQAKYVAAEYLVTAVEDKKVTLSKPLAFALKAGMPVKMATLKYAPFGDAATPEGRASLEGWKRYVRMVAEFAAAALGTQEAGDLGFDLEIWNEMSFGSNFIHQSRYYEPLPHKFDERAVYLDVVRATAEVAEAEPARFAGVRLVDGFSNTLPWPASSELPTRVTALSHHPYAGERKFPEAKVKGTSLNALGLPDTSGFVPQYTSSFPEYFMSALQTETIARDAAPLVTNIFKVEHGRYTRPKAPAWCWITEVNWAPGENGITDRERALALKAKAVTRYFCFHLNKGVERLYLYAAGANEPKEGDFELGVLRQDFVERTRTEKGYPADDLAWTSPALLAVRRIVARMREGLDPKLQETRSLELVGIEETHGAKQWEGDPADLRARPPLLDRDVLAVLPFQVNAGRFVIPYYVVTRDLRKDLPEEKFTLTLRGLKGEEARLVAYDPVLDQRTKVRALPSEAGTLKVEVTARDYPVLLEVEERQ